MEYYAQKYYHTKIGNSNVTIAEGGAFITAVANLLTHFGLVLTPEDIAKGYENIETPDYRWILPSTYDLSVAPIEIAPGAPTSNDSIVSFTYESKLTGEQVTGYACVDDYAKGTIIDSFDGEVRSWEVYGGPVSHATYSRDTLPISLIQLPSEPLTYSIEGKQKGYMTEEDALARTNYAVTFTPGTYYADHDNDSTVYLMPVQDQKGYWINKNGDGDEAIGGTVDTPVSINKEQGSETPSINDEEDTSVPVKVIPKDPNKFKATYKPYLNMVEYYAVGEILVQDIEGLRESKLLPDEALIPAHGEFKSNDGSITYLRTVKSFGEDAWYGIPKHKATKHTDGDDKDINDTIDTIIANDIKNKQIIKVAAKTAGTLTRFNPFSYVKNKETK